MRNIDKSRMVPIVVLSWYEKNRGKMKFSPITRRIVEVFVSKCEGET